jgi:hypothetical protein
MDPKEDRSRVTGREFVVVEEEVYISISVTSPPCCEGVSENGEARTTARASPLAIVEALRLPRSGLILE